MVGGCSSSVRSSAVDIIWQDQNKDESGWRKVVNPREKTGKVHMLCPRFWQMHGHDALKSTEPSTGDGRQPSFQVAWSCTAQQPLHRVASPILAVKMRPDVQDAHRVIEALQVICVLQPGAVTCAKVRPLVFASKRRRSMSLCRPGPVRDFLPIPRLPTL